MKSATLQRILGSLGIIGCSGSVFHVMMEANVPVYYFIFYMLALLGAFVIGAARDVVVVPFEGDQYGTRLPRDDGAPLDYPAPPPPPPPPPKRVFQEYAPGFGGERPHNPPKEK